MSRLYDRLMTREWASPAGSEVVSRLGGLLGDAVVVEASGAVRHFFEESEQEFWNIAHDFPVLSPPFETFFVESVPAKYVRTSEGVSEANRAGVRAFGMLFSSVDYGPSARRSEIALGCGEGTAEEVAESLRGHVGRESERLLPRLDEAVEAERRRTGETPDTLRILAGLPRGYREDVERLSGDAQFLDELEEDEAGAPGRGEWFLCGMREAMRWEVQVVFFAEWEKGRPVGPLHSWNVPVRDDGSVAVPDGTTDRAGGILHGSYLPDSHRREYPGEYEEMTALAQGLLYPALFAVNLLHAPEVGRVERVPPQRLSRKHAKRYGRGLTRYYTLDIEPFKEVLRAEGGSATAGLRKALHLCRGHFRRPKNSEPSAPRTEWVRAHMRGSKKSGEVRKDYGLGPPDGDGNPDGAPGTPGESRADDDTRRVR